MRLQGRVALITGAARGIGLAAARAMLAEGARVTLFDDDPLQAAAEALLQAGLPARAVRVDVSDHGSIARAIETTVAAWGQLDVLLSNAAITDDTPLESLSPEGWHKVLAVNLDSVLYGAKAAVPHLGRSRFMISLHVE